MPSSTRRRRDQESESEGSDDEFALELAAARAAVREANGDAGSAGEGQSDSDASMRANALRHLVDDREDLPWPETLVVGEVPLALEDVHDDLQREVAFYNAALASVKRGRALLLEHKVPYARPADFFCEMIKSDEHMARIRDKLAFETQKMEAFEQRKRRDQQRKFAKEVHSNRLKERAEKKRETMNAIEDWRNTARGRAGIDDGDDDEIQGLLKSGEKRRRGAGLQGPNKKRQARDRKYGFGGPKRGAKRGDAKSLNDFSSFDPRKGKATKKGAGPKRAGKRARAAARSRR